MLDSPLRAPVAEIRTEVELETVCSLLESECRRRVLRVLGDAPRTTRHELGRALARDGRRTRPAERVEASLHHVHLPKLADANAIRYDPDAGTVAITEDGERVLQCLDALERRLGGREDVR